jgi:hypothetical protein
VVPEKDNPQYDVVKMLKACGVSRNSFLVTCAHEAILAHDWMKSKSEEPPQRGKLAEFVDGRFEALCFLVVIVNGIFIVVTTNYQMQHLESTLPLGYRVAEALFLIYYLVELSLKLAVHKGYFFCNKDAGFNVFDSLVIVIATFDFVTELLTAKHSRNPSFLRLVRLLKMVRVLRVAKGLRFVREIRLVLDMLVLSFGTLARSIILLTFILGVFAIFFVQECRDYLANMDPILFETESVQYFLRFGTVERATLSLFMAITGGEDWSVQQELFDKQKSYTSYCYMFFIAFFMIAFWNIVTGQFMSQTLKLAAPDMEEALFLRRKQDVADTSALLKLVKKGDVDHDGSLTLNEFKMLMRNEEFITCLELRGIDIKDTQMFFEMLTISSGNIEDKVDIGHFVHACLRMKGVATSLDLHSMDFELRLMHRKSKQFMLSCTRKLDEIAQMIARTGMASNASTHQMSPRDTSAWAL